MCCNAFRPASGSLYFHSGLCQSDIMPPAAQWSGNRKSTPLPKGKATAQETCSTKPGRGTPLHKGAEAPTKAITRTPHHGQDKDKSSRNTEHGQACRTRRKRGGTHLKRDGSSQYISASVTTMFRWGPFDQNSTDILSQPSQQGTHTVLAG